jgi:sugar lactone lactonase YvrE
MGLGGPYALTGRVVRVDRASGAVSVVVAGDLDAPGTFSCGTVGIALEPDGATALAADYHRGVARVALPRP